MTAVMALRRRDHRGGDGQGRKGRCRGGGRGRGGVQSVFEGVVAVRTRRGGRDNGGRRRRSADAPPSPHCRALPRPLCPAERHQVDRPNRRRGHARRQASPVERCEHRRGLRARRREQLERSAERAVSGLLHDLDGVQRIKRGQLSNLACSPGKGVSDDRRDLEGLFRFLAACLVLLWKVEKRKRKSEGEPCCASVPVLIDTERVDGERRKTAAFAAAAASVENATALLAPQDSSSPSPVLNSALDTRA